MAYQPLYATVSDNQVGKGHTSSLRGIVTSVDMNLNTHFGGALQVDAFSEGTLTKKDEAHAEFKIGFWKIAGNQRKVEQWQKKLEYYKMFNAEQEKKEYVRIGINMVPGNKKFRYTINGIGFNLDEFELFHDVYLQNRPMFNKIKLANEIEKQAEESKI